MEVFFLDVNIDDPNEIIKLKPIIKIFEEQREEEGEQLRPFTYIYYLFFKVIHIDMERMKYALKGDTESTINKQNLANSIFSEFKQYLHKYFGHWLSNVDSTLIKNQSQN